MSIHFESSTRPGGAAGTARTTTGTRTRTTRARTYRDRRGSAHDSRNGSVDRRRCRDCAILVARQSPAREPSVCAATACHSSARLVQIYRNTWRSLISSPLLASHRIALDYAFVLLPIFSTRQPTRPAYAAYVRVCLSSQRLNNLVYIRTRSNTTGLSVFS